MLTVEVARLLAERLDRLLVLPDCNSSPYGPQACSDRPDLPAQAQSIVAMPLERLVERADLSRCTAPRGARPELVTLNELPLTAQPRPVTCVIISTHGPAWLTSNVSDGSATRACQEEHAADPRQRSVALRFVAAASVPVDSFLHGSRAREQLRGLGDVYVAGAFHHFSRGRFGPSFSVCALPRETAAVSRLARELGRVATLDAERTLCVHWRGEDFLHRARVAWSRSPPTAQALASQVLPYARQVGAREVLLLSNARCAM